MIIGLTITLDMSVVLKIIRCLFGVSHCSGFWNVKCNPYINQLSDNQFIPKENQMQPKFCPSMLI